MSDVRPWARIGLLIALVLGAGLAIVLLVPQPAHADGCVYFDEDDMRFEPVCRPFVADPGVGQFLDRNDLTTPARLAVYGNWGYTEQWMWYSFERTRTVGDGQVDWAACLDLISAGQTCATNRIVFEDAGLGFIQNPVLMHVYEFDGAWMSRVCGNFTRPPGRDPVPTIAGRKFHDLNGDGTRQGGEPWLSGVKFRLYRLTTQAGQSLGFVDEVTTDGNGRFEFVLNGEYPGLYEVREVADPMWESTTPTSRQVLVNPGIGSAELNGGTYGNVARTNVAKTGFELVDPPDQLEARSESQITVRSRIANFGPYDRPVAVRETTTLTGPADCDVRIEPATVDVVVPTFSTVVVDQTAFVTCDLPSWHTFEFSNVVELTQPGVEDTNPNDNSLSFSWTVPVLADADLAVTALDLDCTDEALKGVPFACTATGTVANLGPYGPVEAAITVGLNPAPDCEAEVVAPAASPIWIDAGQTAPISQEWSVVCDMRSDHTHNASAAITAIDVHVVDAQGNNSLGATEDNEVFEPAELEALDARILCTEIWDGDPFTCTLEVDVVNHGPGTAVDVTVSGELTGSPDCAAVPARLQEVPENLDAGESITATFVWELSCANDTPHVFTAFGRIVQAEPHVIDDPANNEVKIVWLPIDFKPFSDPNSVNPGRGGVTSVAILATPDFDPFTEIIVDSLRFGPAGATAVQCASEPEDLNGDGLGDMSCKFRNRDIGWEAGQELVFLTGDLANGCRFMAADRVRIIV